MKDHQRVICYEAQDGGNGGNYERCPCILRGWEAHERVNGDWLAREGKALAPVPTEDTAENHANVQRGLMGWAKGYN